MKKMKEEARQKSRCLQGRQVLFRLVLVLVGILTWACDSALAIQQVNASGKEDQNPNILLITTDDLGMEVGCYGDPIARTPHIDHLAAKGVRFENAYVTQASCSSSRSSILTGLYPHQNNQIGLANCGFKMHSSIITLPQILKKSGYRTGVIGKVHVSPEGIFPFDFDRRRLVTETRDVRRVARLARQFLQENRRAPFFLMVNYYDPHRPFSSHEDQYLGLPIKPLKGADIKPLRFLGVDSTAVRTQVATYYNCISRVDSGVGLLLDIIDQAGFTNNTIVIFIGDHGPPFTRAKTTCYEAGLKVPMIIKWPKNLSSCTVRDELTSTIDIVPTLLDLAKIERPVPLPGMSLKPLLLGRKTPWRETVFSESTFHTDKDFFPRRSIRNKRYKLIHNLILDKENPIRFLGVPKKDIPPPNTVIGKGYQTYLKPPEFELYDLENDPQEWENLAYQEDFRAIRTDLLTRLNLWQRQTKDPLLDREKLKISRLLQP